VSALGATAPFTYARPAAAGIQPPNGSIAANTLDERATVTYQPAESRFRYTFDYDVPPEITELTITIDSLAYDDGIAVSETRGVDRDGQTAFVWDGGRDPQVVVDRHVGGSRLSGGVSGTYVGDGLAFASRVRTRLPFRYDGSAPARNQTISVEGDGHAGGSYVYAGPHRTHARTIDGSPVTVVVPDEVQATVRHEQLLDAFELGAETIRPRLSPPPLNLFALPSSRGVSGGFAVMGDVVVEAKHARVDAVDSVATHEYAHTRYGVFGSGEMYWLKEAVAEYYGCLLALNAGAGTFETFLREVETEDYQLSVLTDAAAMKRTTADYEKGAHVLAAMDAEIQRASDGASTLQDVVTTPDHDLSTYAGFSAAVERAAGDAAITDWIDEYVPSAGLPEIPDEPRYYALGDRDLESIQTTTATATPSTGPWTASTTGDASVSGAADGVSLRAYRCANATATRSLDAGATSVSFDYEIESDQWWELPYVEILVDGAVVWAGGVGASDAADETVFDISAGDTTTGSVTKELDVAGETAIRFGITPSKHCSSGDHGNTWLRIENLAVSRPSTATDTPTETATETSSPTPTAERGPGFGVGSALASLGGVGYLVKRRLGRDDES
jgi:hypothetical protein